MKKADKMSRAVSQLEHIYNALNTDFFGGALLTPVITVQSKPGTCGHFTPAKVWVRSEDMTHELNISAETLNYPIEELIDTILHEQVHLYCEMHGIKDTSRRGTYHNKRFKEQAEAHGLTCYMTERYGWNTRPGENLIEYALSKDWNEIKIARNTFLPFPTITGISGNSNQTEGGKRPSSTRKLICPDCGQSVRATKKVNILCGDCMTRMIEA